MSRYCQTCAAGPGVPDHRRVFELEHAAVGQPDRLRSDAPALLPQLVEARGRRPQAAGRQARTSTPISASGGPSRWNSRQNASLTSSTRPSSDSTTTPSLIWATRLFNSNDVRVALPLELLLPGRHRARSCRRAALSGDVETRADIAFELAGRGGDRNAGRVYQAVHAVGAQPPVCRLEGHSGGEGLGKRRQAGVRDRQDGGRPPSPSPSSCSGVRPLKSSQRSFT